MIREFSFLGLLTILGFLLVPSKVSAFALNTDGDSIKTKVPLKRPAMLASMREMELTGDSTPEVLRIEGKVVPKTDQIVLRLTVKQGKKIVFSDSWKAAGYFDPIDSLTEDRKFARLQRIVNYFFTNENFTWTDSLQLTRLIRNTGEADVKLGSMECDELGACTRTMYNVYVSRDYWYGLIWLPSQKKFVRAWRN